MSARTEDIAPTVREVLDISEAAHRLWKFYGRGARLRMLTKEAPSGEMVSALDAVGIEVVLSPHVREGRKFLVGPDDQGRSLPVRR